MNRIRRFLMGTNLGKSQNKFLSKLSVKTLKIEPNENVLELSCAGGVGLKSASWRVAEGEGFVAGVDMHTTVLDRARRLCRKEIDLGKVGVFRCLPSHLPFDDDTFDAIFHGNGFIFWPHLEGMCSEMFRVLKPGGRLVATLYIDGIKKYDDIGARGFAVNADPLIYLCTLESTGFKDVQVKYSNVDQKMLQTVHASRSESESRILPSLEDQEKQLAFEINYFDKLESVKHEDNNHTGSFEKLVDSVDNADKINSKLNDDVNQ